jgi:hypothetical protein
MIVTVPTSRFATTTVLSFGETAMAEPRVEPGAVVGHVYPPLPPVPVVVVAVVTPAPPPDPPLPVLVEVDEVPLSSPHPPEAAAIAAHPNPSVTKKDGPQGRIPTLFMFSAPMAHVRRSSRPRAGRKR